MKRLLTMLLICCLGIIGCQTKDVSTKKTTLDDSKLTLTDKNMPKEVNPKIYKPVSLEKTKEVIPYTPKLPPNPLKGYEPIQQFYIEDWGQKQKIAIETKIIPDKSNQNTLGIYSLRIANFPDYPSDIINKKQYTKEITLKNNINVYYRDYQLAWKENNIEYLISYILDNNASNNMGQKQIEDRLVEFANSMK
ncbi:hypothetical protein ACFDTO_27530 [Microbacteriaceae bacterium 4G12]